MRVNKILILGSKKHGLDGYNFLRLTLPEFPLSLWLSVSMRDRLVPTFRMCLLLITLTDGLWRLANLIDPPSFASKLKPICSKLRRQKYWEASPNWIEDCEFVLVNEVCRSSRWTRTWIPSKENFASDKICATFVYRLRYDCEKGHTPSLSFLKIIESCVYQQHAKLFIYRFFSYI
jgi:hypothetical protein